MSTDKNIYEIGYLLKTNLKDEDVLAFSEKLRNIITEKSGLVINEGKVKKEILAYPIKKELTAFFNWIKFSISTKLSSVEEIKEYLDKQEQLIRFLIIKATREDQKPTSFKPFSKTREKFKKFSFIKKEDTQKEVPTIAKNDLEFPTPPKADIGTKEEEIDKQIEELLGE
ncbi:30S ribosomal protein S6 [Patescibacteria group bacterium]